MPPDTVQAVYFTFQLPKIFGLVTLPILTCTILFSPSVKRHHTVPNYTFLWALSSAISCILLFSGQLNDPSPSKTLCQAQSALMLAQPVSLSAATFILVWKLWSIAVNVRANVGLSQEPWWLTVLLLGSPYFIWAVLAVVFAVLQAKSRVHQITFYCTSSDQTLGIISGVLAAVFLVLTLVFQVWTTVITYGRYRRSRRLGRAEIGDVSVPFFTRIMSFAALVFIGLVLALVATAMFSLIIPDIVIAVMGPIMFLIFSSQGDILAAWRIHRPPPGFTDSQLSEQQQQSTSARAHLRQPTVAEVEVTYERPSKSPLCRVQEGLKSVHQLSVRIHQSVFSADTTTSDSKSTKTLSPHVYP